MPAKLFCAALSVLLFVPVASVHAQPAPGTGSRDVVFTPDPTGQDLAIQHGDYRLALTGLVQVQGAPVVGDDALVENGDPATEEGFRIRRARFGAFGDLPGDFTYRLYFELFDDVSTDTVDGRPVGARLRDALIGWRRYAAAMLVAGAGKVPFSRGNLSSSAESAIVTDPLVVEHLGIDRRVGASVYGSVGLISYGAGVFNADPALSFGNRTDGLLGAGRLEIGTDHIGYGQSTVGPGADAPGGFRVGGGAAYRRDATLSGYTVGGDVAFRHAMLVVTGEFLYGHTEPLDTPELPTPFGAATDVTTLGGYVTLAVNLLEHFEVAVRCEYFDENTQVDNENDLLVIAGGLNAALADQHLKAGLSYQHKRERHGRSLSNDALVLQLQASF